MVTMARQTISEKFENNIDKATELYKMATVLAEAFGDQVFIKNLKMEMEKDLNLE